MRFRLLGAAAVLTCALVANATPVDDLTSRIDALTAKVEATVGISAIDTMTGRKVSIRGDERFPMASVYKFPIALAVLRRASMGEISLDDQITVLPKDFSPGHSPLVSEAKGKAITLPLGTLIVYALRDSDNTASDMLMRQAGGPAAVVSYLRFLGVNDIDISRTEKKIAADTRKSGSADFWRDPRDTSTPAAMVLLLRLFNEKAHGLNAGSQQFVHEMMLRTTSGAGRIVAGAPSATAVIHKTGTMSGVVNDVGIIEFPDERHRIVIAVFTKGWKKTPQDAREKLIADITREVCAEFLK